MKNKPFLPKKIIALTIIFTALIITGVWIYNSTPTRMEKKADYDLISTQGYDSVFLSMYPTDGFDESYYAYYRGMNLIRPSHCISNFATLKNYLDRIAKSGNTIHTIYLGVCPEKIPASELFNLLAKYPSVIFEVVPAYPSIDHWTSLSTTDYETLLQSYYEYTTLSLNAANTNFYSFFATEWLIANPTNYIGDLVLNEDIARSIMLYTDSGHGYQFTSDNVEGIYEQFNNLIFSYQTNPITYPDLSDWDIVFFGDSVIGNYHNSTSIPNVLTSLTNARTYNCAIGGTTATLAPDAQMSLTQTVDHFLQQKLSSFSTAETANTVLERYYREATPERNLCFVIHYGLNDYFTGAPLIAEDTYDTSGFSGALRTGIEQLKSSYPNAKFLLIAPNFTSYFTNGTEKTSSYGGTLSEYVDTILSVADEYSIPVLNNYTDLPINAQNHAQYLVDGCHPNEAGRLLIGSSLAQKCYELLE